jgi:hypothetical protein
VYWQHFADGRRSFACLLDLVWFSKTKGAGHKGRSQAKKKKRPLRSLPIGFKGLFW